MKAETAASLIESHEIPRNPDAPVMLVAALSLLLPGLGQAYLGQWSRGLRVFAGSATLCFGLGLANALAAYDAYSLAQRNRNEAIASRTSSKTLLVFTTMWSGFCLALDALIAGLIEAPGPGVLLALPLMGVSYIGGGKGFRR